MIFIYTISYNNKTDSILKQTSISPLAPKKFQGLSFTLEFNIMGSPSKIDIICFQNLG